MKNAVRLMAGLAVAVCLVMTAGNAMAGENGPKFKLGLGAFALVVSGDNSVQNEDMEFFGGAVAGTACINKHVAVRAAYYSAEDDDYSGYRNVLGRPIPSVDLDVSGVDFQVLLGTNFYEGWNFFGGVGAFYETVTVTDYLTVLSRTIALRSKDHLSGAQGTVGVGYSWSRVALDYMINVRDSSDYDEALLGNYDGAVSSSLTLSYIF